MKITAYPLYDHTTTLQPAQDERKWLKAAEPGELAVMRNTEATQSSLYAALALSSANRQGWELLCPVAFEAIWNGGPSSDDIEIRLVENAAEGADFVQSRLGEGLLSFYPGYQFKTETEYVLWVRGPINTPKDGLYPLESMVDASILPCTVAVHWKFTRPDQIVRFEASEPFGAILPYPRSDLDNLTVEVMQLEGDIDAHEQAFQQMLDDPVLHSLFLRMDTTPIDLMNSEQRRASDSKYAHSKWAAQLTNPPPVSCICPTYGRAELLEEAIYSFLLQDYPGRKELIVLNDYGEQTLVFDHPEVRVINVPSRFRTVGEKRNAAIALASHDLLFPWDDDDICLPHRLSFSVVQFELQKGFFKAGNVWQWNHGQLSGPVPGPFHGTSCCSRRLFDAVRYGAVDTGHDRLFERQLAQRWPGTTEPYDTTPEEIYYIFRWAGTGSYHMGRFERRRQGEPEGSSPVETFVRQQASRGEIRRGRIPLQPHWKTDYRQLVSSYIAALAGKQL